MSQFTRFIYAVSFVLAGAGFILPLWPLSVVGVLLAALSRRYVFAVIIGVLLDLAWGPPQGVLHVLYVPFTLLALLATAARFWGSSYFLDRNIDERL